MFPTSDSISEVVAHFIGSFEIRVDEMRMRHAYEDFYRGPDRAIADAPIQHLSPGFHQHLEIGLYDPGVIYRPRLDKAEINAEARPAHIHLEHIPPALSGWTHSAWAQEVRSVWAEGAEAAGEPEPYMGEEPGSVILVASQTMELVDNDIVVLGDIEIGSTKTLGDAEPLQVLMQAGLAVSEALGGIAAPEQVDVIPTYFASVEAAIAAIAGEQGGNGSALISTSAHQQAGDIAEDITIITGPAITGIYGDGAELEAAPSLQQALPQQLQTVLAEAQEPTSPVQALVIDPASMAVSMEVEAGTNMMVNQALIANAGLTSTFLAVAGDYHSINAIIQTNIHSDVDRVDSRLTGAAQEGDSTNAHNIAVFAAQAGTDAAEHAAQNPGAYPGNWQVSVVQGDMVFVDWIKQYNFTSDGDTLVLSATGTTTTITSGENLGLNSVSFADIGHYYDLIIVGGSLYDGNVIVQTNVLYDNDMLTLLSGTGGNGASSTSGNLLWNSASILNIGANTVQTGLPDAYGQAIASLGAADYSMPASFHSDGSFQGFDGLRALYIAGNLYDLHSVHQVNVMGDADLVALYEDGGAGSPNGVDWDISTGSNALINVASIIDYDSMGSDVHVGGQIYSDAILIQADLMAGSDTQPMAGDALVSEVIAFLDIDIDANVPGDADHSIMPAGDGHIADAMGSVLT